MKKLLIPLFSSLLLLTACSNSDESKKETAKNETKTHEKENKNKEKTQKKKMNKIIIKKNKKIVNLQNK